MTRITDLLDELGAAAGAIVPAWAIQVSLLMVLLWMLERALGQRLRPAVRHALWLLVPLKLILPPTFALPTGVGYWIVQALGSDSESLPASPGLSRAALLGTSASPADLPSVGTPHVYGCATLLWLLGTTTFLAVGVVGSMRLRRQLKRARDPGVEPGAALADHLRGACDQVGFQREVGLHLVVEHRSPAICGWWRPVILLPQGLVDRWSPPQIRAVLVHELLHAKRGDHWIDLVLAVLQAVWWWHPLVWLAHARLQAAREEAVDDAVMSRLGPDAIEYPAALVATARFIREGVAVRALGVPMLGPQAHLPVRIRRLLDSRPPAPAELGRSGFIGVLLTGLLVVPMAGCRNQDTSQATVAAPPMAIDLVARRGTVRDNARKALPIVAELRRLFPGGDDQILETPGKWLYVYQAGLHGRYRFSVNVGLSLDGWSQTVTGWEAPRIHVTEVVKIVPLTRGLTGFQTTTATPLEIDPGTWRRLVDANGDFDRIGYPMRRDRPVDFFDQACSGYGSAQR